jgi:hypothetical protein
MAAISFAEQPASPSLVAASDAPLAVAVYRPGVQCLGRPLFVRRIDKDLVPGIAGLVRQFADEQLKLPSGQNRPPVIGFLVMAVKAAPTRFTSTTRCTEGRRDTADLWGFGIGAIFCIH